MQFTRNTCLLGLAVTWLCLSSAVIAQDGLKLAGLSTYSETGRDIYLAGLRLPPGTSLANLVNEQPPKAMEYRIASRRISTRGFSGTLLLQAELGSGQRPPESVVSTLEAVKRNMKGALLQGDHVVIYLNDDAETVFLLNDTELGRVADETVFDYFLAGWVGPESAGSFHDNLVSGKINLDMLGRFNRLMPSEERIAKVASWPAPGAASAPATAAAPAASTPKATPVAPASNPAAGSPLPEPLQDKAIAPDTQEPANEIASGAPLPASSISTPPAAPPAGVDLSATASPDSEMLADTSDPDAITAAAPSPGLETPREDSPGQVAHAQDSPTKDMALLSEPTPALTAEAPGSDLVSGEQTQSAPGESGAKPGPPTVDTEAIAGGTRAAAEQETVLESGPPAAESAVALVTDAPAESKTFELDDREYQRQLREYVSLVMRKVYGQVKYPKRAIKFDWEGRVELLVRMDVSGKLLDVSIDSTSGYPGLDNAALDAVKRGAPFPDLNSAAQEELAAEDGEGYIMSIPVTFAIER